MARARHASSDQAPGPRSAKARKPPGHSDVFLKLDRLIGARVEEQRRQQAETE
jgi:hypothetical protein